MKESGWKPLLLTPQKKMAARDKERMPIYFASAKKSDMLKI